MTHPTKADLIAALTAGGHVGAARGIAARHLAGRLDCPERHVRDLVTQARRDGTAICGVPRDGYYIADTADELEQTCRFLRGRAMCSLELEAALRRMKLPDLLGQMRLPT